MRDILTISQPIFIFIYSMRWLVIILAIVSALAASYFLFYKKPAVVGKKPTLQKLEASHIITLKTNLGEIQLQTYDADAPKTVKNFVDLAQKGFYNGLTFHRVIKGFMIQGGDPNGDGTGGPGYTFADELNPEAQSYQEGYKKGIVAMANAGPNTNGSQFFIMHEDYPLPNNYTIFGRVIKGQEVVDKIATTATDSKDKPLEPVLIEGVNVD